VATPASFHLSLKAICCVADLQTGQQGAMKVVKSAAHYTEAARDEITLLSQITGNDPGERRRSLVDGLKLQVVVSH
jgi:hypothetical protein